MTYSDVIIRQVPDRSHTAAFSKAIARFQKEDPTFRVHVDPESNQVWNSLSECQHEVIVTNDDVTFLLILLFFPTLLLLF